MTPEQLKSWRKALGLSQQSASEALGIGRRTVQDYEKGVYQIPRTVALACAALYHRINEYSA